MPILSSFKVKKISAPKTLGEILRSARKKKEISLAQTEEETKVRQKYLEALEESRYEALPGDVYALGFLTKYADFLNLDKNEMINRFKTERGESALGSRLMPIRRMKESGIYFTQRHLVIGAITLCLVGVLGYIIYSVRVFTMPPNLEISNPSTKEILKEDNMVISGKTDASVTLKINDQNVLLDGNGNFSQEVKLNPGLNTFQVTASNRLKKVTTKQVQILAQY